MNLQLLDLTFCETFNIINKIMAPETWGIHHIFVYFVEMCVKKWAHFAKILNIEWSKNTSKKKYNLIKLVCTITSKLSIATVIIFVHNGTSY